VVGAVLLVARSLDVDALGRSATPSETDTNVSEGSGAARLALDTVGGRAQRSTVGVGPATGFVGWETNGLTLVLTARPAGGWQVGERRFVPVRYGDRTYGGALVRTEPVSGLGLVRVRNAGVADPLWPETGTAPVAAGDLVIVVGRSSSRTVEVERVGTKRIYFAGSGLGTFVGAPVLDASGQLVGVVDAGGGATPLARACGVIRRC